MTLEEKWEIDDELLEELKKQEKEEKEKEK